MKITIEQKNKIKDEIQIMLDKLTDDAYVQCDQELGHCVTLDYPEDSIISILNIVGVDDDLDTTLSIEYILENYETLNLDEVSELRQVDQFTQDNGETKYKYIATIYKHKGTENNYKFVTQWSNDEYQEKGSTYYEGQVELKENIIKEWKKK